MNESVFVVIAAYNESSCIADVVREVRAICPNVTVVDDGSTDDTFASARNAATWTLRHVINRGQGAALQTGIEFALARGAAFIVTFDADGQHDPADIEAMLAPILSGEAEITLGSRFLGSTTGMTGSRRFLLKGAVLFTRIFNGVRLTDAHNGLRAFSRRAAERIHIKADRMAHASELIDIIRHTRLPFREVPVRIRYTEYSMAKGQSHFAAARIVFHYLIGRIFPRNGFQILILTVLAGLAVATVVFVLRNWLSVGLALGLFVMWIGGAVLAVRPATATDIARLLGIGRGADLVFYCSALLMLVGFFMVYIRIRRLRASLTELVREIAIMRAEGPSAGGADRD